MPAPCPSADMAALVSPRCCSARPAPRRIFADPARTDSLWSRRPWDYRAPGSSGSPRRSSAPGHDCQASPASSPSASLPRTHSRSPEGTDEQVGAVKFLAAGTPDRHRAARIIHEQLLAGKVSLAHRALEPSRPFAIARAEGAAAVGSRAVLRTVFLPQLQGHVLVALELCVDPG